MIEIPYIFVNAGIISHRRLTKDVFHLRLSATSDIFNSFTPGKFSMIRVSKTLDPLLNRPFSISFVNEGKNWFDILYRVVGKGTRILSNKKAGDNVDVILPLGRGFPLKKDLHSPITLVGGGMGIAPLLSILSKDKKEKITVLWGIKNKGDYFEIGKLYPNLNAASFLISSEDGFIGKKGTVIDLFLSHLKEYETLNSVIYACGAIKMLHFLHKICKERGLSLYVSLETRMACGFGYCMGCAVPSIDGRYLKTCQDGPVFDSRDLDWGKIERLD